MDQTLPLGFIVDLINNTFNNSWDEFKTVFSPLIQSLIMEGRESSIVEATYTHSLTALKELCEIKIAGNNRPICQLITELVSGYAHRKFHNFFLSPTFYVKSILANLEYQKLPF